MFECAHDASDGVSGEALALLKELLLGGLLAAEEVGPPHVNGTVD